MIFIKFHSPTNQSRGTITFFFSLWFAVKNLPRCDLFQNIVYYLHDQTCQYSILPVVSGISPLFSIPHPPFYLQRVIVVRYSFEMTEKFTADRPLNSSRLLRPLLHMPTSNSAKALSHPSLLRLGHFSKLYLSHRLIEWWKIVVVLQLVLFKLLINAFFHEADH